MVIDFCWGYCFSLLVNKIPRSRRIPGQKNSFTVNGWFSFQLKKQPSQRPIIPPDKENPGIPSETSLFAFSQKIEGEQNPGSPWPRSADPFRSPGQAQMT
jgi:hypothetical protein